MKTCLIVDDSRVVRTVARRILEDLSYSVEEAEDGMAGLRAARDKMPDLIFLDWNLPDMKGVDFVKSVRGQERGRDRKSTRLNSSHVEISYAVFCLKKKKTSM